MILEMSLERWLRVNNKERGGRVFPADGTVWIMVPGLERRRHVKELSMAGAQSEERLHRGRVGPGPVWSRRPR